MTKDQYGVWTPSANDIESAKVTELGRLLGVSDYDALYRLSIDEPERYWRTVTDYCGIVWQRPYDRLVDLSGHLLQLADAGEGRADETKRPPHDLKLLPEARNFR